MAAIIIGSTSVIKGRTSAMDIEGLMFVLLRAAVGSTIRRTSTCNNISPISLFCSQVITSEAESAETFPYEAEDPAG